MRLILEIIMLLNIVLTLWHDRKKYGDKLTITYTFASVLLIVIEFSVSYLGLTETLTALLDTVSTILILFILALTIYVWKKGRNKSK